MKLELKINNKHIPVMIADGMQIKDGLVEVYVRINEKETHVGDVKININEKFGIYESELKDPINFEIKSANPMYWQNPNDRQHYLSSIVLLA